MKKETKILVVVLACILIMFSLVSCNKQIVDLNYSFNYAIIRLPDGTIVEGKVQSWTDYEDGEQLQVKIDGVTYLTSSFNCTLIHK